MNVTFTSDHAELAGDLLFMFLDDEELSADYNRKGEEVTIEFEDDSYIREVQIWGGAALLTGLLDSFSVN